MPANGVRQKVAALLAKHWVKKTFARELQCCMIRDGCKNKQDSRSTFNSENTVNFHIKNIVDKLGANDRTHAVTIALRRDCSKSDGVSLAMEILQVCNKDSNVFNTLNQIKSCQCTASFAISKQRHIPRIGFKDCVQFGGPGEAANKEQGLLPS